MRVYFSAWGRKANELELPKYAVCRAFESRIEAVCRAIGSKTRMIVLCRYDNTKIERSQPIANQYQLTLGKPANGGGITPSGQIWVEVKI